MLNFSIQKYLVCLSTLLLINDVLPLVTATSGNYSFARSVLITGTNRGQGLEWVKQLSQLPTPPEFIFATCRQPENERHVLQLKALADSAERSNIIILKLDVTNTSQMIDLIDQLNVHLEDIGLNVLINNAGYFDRSTASLYTSTMAALTYTFQVNAAGPLLLAQNLIPLLKKAASKSEMKPEMGVQRAAIISLSSVMGSIYRSSGGYYSYRMAKAAQNMATKTMSEDLQSSGIMAVGFHPGWVQTRMGGANARITAAQSVSSMMHAVVQFYERNTGGYYDRNGNPIPF